MNINNCGIVTVSLGLIFCIALILSDKWLRYRGIATNHTLAVLGLFLLGLASLVAAYAVGAVSPQEERLLSGIIIIGYVTVDATIIGCIMARE